MNFHKKQELHLPQQVFPIHIKTLRHLTNNITKNRLLDRHQNGSVIVWLEIHNVKKDHKFFLSLSFDNAVEMSSAKMIDSASVLILSPFAKAPCICVDGFGIRFYHDFCCKN